MRSNLRDPSFLGALVHFERVASLLSFAGAAGELGVTPSAVSHRISQLEATLGKRLFERSPRRVTLTPEGLELQEAMRSVTEVLRRVTGAIQDRSVLRVSVGPYLSATWLMPRLARFEALHPGLRVDLLHRAGWPDLKDVDLAIAWHDDPPRAAGARALFEPTCVPVAAPGMTGGRPIWEDRLPLLHYRNRDTWRQWLAHVGGPTSLADTGEIFEDPNLILEAAAHRRGAAIGFLPFIASQIESGRLVVIDDRAVRPGHRYWLLRASDDPVVTRMCEWLIEEAASTLLSVA